ncbi:hypothetical protein H4R34_004242 [Dimargaris verticillata]|uniref:HAUS augmin-like complex subunit 3 N-terminal domain-containing protein n=1 Tax=Dimargaris verticillata TaxID=2761393 RepID=A0A9W8B0K8_9FUNG|nr:hypothetical protein H4R34_004242 [Dimargaris verticillata]
MLADSATASYQYAQRFLQLLTDLEYPPAVNLEASDLAWAFQLDGARELLQWVTDTVEPTSQALSLAEWELHTLIQSTNSGLSTELATAVNEHDDWFSDRELTTRLADVQEQAECLDAQNYHLVAQNGILEQTLQALEEELAETTAQVAQKQDSNRRLDVQLQALAVEHDLTLEQEVQAMSALLACLALSPSTCSSPRLPEQPLPCAFQATASVQALANNMTTNAFVSQACSLITTAFDRVQTINPTVCAEFPQIPQDIPQLYAWLDAEMERLGQAIAKEETRRLAIAEQTSYLQALVAALPDEHACQTAVESMDTHQLSLKAQAAQHQVAESKWQWAEYLGTQLPQIAARWTQRTVKDPLECARAHLHAAYNVTLTSQLDTIDATVRQYLNHLEGAYYLLLADWAQQSRLIESVHDRVASLQSDLTRYCARTRALTTPRMTTTLADKAAIDHDDPYYMTVHALVTRAVHHWSQLQGCSSPTPPSPLPSSHGLFVTYTHLVDQARQFAAVADHLDTNHALEQSGLARLVRECSQCHRVTRNMLTAPSPLRELWVIPNELLDLMAELKANANCLRPKLRQLQAALQSTQSQEQVHRLFQLFYEAAGSVSDSQNLTRFLESCRHH